jgi:hypothetical protein
VTRVALLLALGSTQALADDRPVHGSVAVGGDLLFTGREGGSLQRAAAELDVEPGGALGVFGGLVALRAFDAHHAGLLCAGIVFEAAAARPTLVLDLHADLGFDLDVHALLAGAGLRTTVGIVGPLAIALDTGGYLVIDGFDHTRLALMSSAELGLRW